MRSIFTSTALSALVLATSLNSAHAVNIAIVDTGLNPGILGAAIEPGGFDFVNNDADPNDNDSVLHGTAVGDVAVRSGLRVTLTGIKAFEERFGTSNSITEAAFNYTATLDNVRVVNYSGSSLTNTPLAAIKANTDAGKIVVFQAGNKGGPDPLGDAQKVDLLDGLGIVAGGLQPDGQSLQYFSNRAGNKRNFYVAAFTNSFISSSDGTSMSAPRVSAAAATLMERFPWLEPEQVVQIIFDSADDLGQPGIDSTYGHGALNLGAALQAVGAGEIPDDSDGGGGGGGGGGVAVVALVAGGALAYALTNKEEELQRTVLVDSFGRAFRFGLADRITVNDSRPDPFALMESHKRDFEAVTLSQSEFGYSQAYVSERDFRPYSFNAGDEQLDQYVSFLHRTNAPNYQYAMGLNSDLAMDFGALSIVDRNPDNAQSRFFMNDMFSTPILGYSSMGSSFMYGWNDDAVNHKFGMAVIDDQNAHGQVSNSLLYESSVTKDKVRVGMQLGALIEDGSLLGGSSDSALGVDETSTYYVGFNGSYNITDRIAVLGGYFQGFSSVDAGKKSLLSDVSGLRTEGYAMGIMVDDLFSPKGSFGFSYSSPMQTTSGSATLTLPVSQDANTGKIGFESSDLSFKDGDQEKVWEMYYNYDLNRKSSIFTHFSYTQNPVSNLDASNEKTLYVGWRHQF